MLQQIQFLAGKEEFRRAPIRTAVRLCSWKVHCLLSIDAVVTLEGTPLRMSLAPQWHGHSKLLYALGWHFDPELPFLAERIAEGAFVFDVGANLGAWSLILSHALGPAGRIYAYEPARAMYESFCRNITLNSAENIFAFPLALSDSDGQVRIYHDVDCSRNSLGPTRNPDSTDYEEASSKTLDAAAVELSLDRLDLIKIDVEGAEPLVLKGARSTLQRFKPVVLFEVNPTALAALGFDCSSSWRILSDLDYGFYELQSGELHKLSRWPAEMTNVWAIHASSRAFETARAA